MSSCQRYFLPALGLVNALGGSTADVAESLFRASTDGLRSEAGWLPNRMACVGRVGVELPAIPSKLSHLGSRTNQLLLQALLGIQHEVDRTLTTFGRARVAVLVGTSNSGIEEGTCAFEQAASASSLPSSYSYRQQELGSAALFLAEYLGVTGPCYTISTACTSSAKVFAAGQRLLDAGLCDAVILGGSDALARLTVSGFTALESTDEQICKPMSRHRAGINIGEGAALFVLSRQESAIQLLGVGESSDAYHISSPHPQGIGAEQAMRQALANASVSAEQVSYLNLHGTATVKNDEMEALAVSRVFPQGVFTSSTKSMTGHLLGAAGATEVGVCWLALQHHRLPPHVWDHAPDEQLPTLNLVKAGQLFPAEQGRVCMSNSFAFGGNNACVIIGDSK